MISVSFLSAGPALQYTPPTGFLPIPVLYSPLSIDRSWARSLVFYPTVLDDEVLADLRRDMEPASARIFANSDKVAGFYEEAVGQTHLRWGLESGGLYSHIRDEDQGQDGIQFGELLASIEVIDTGLTPIVLTSGRLSVEALSKPGYEENIDFVRLEPGSTSITGSIKIRRPGWVRPSVRLTTTDVDGSVVHKRGVTQLVDIRLRGVGSVEDTEAVADELALAVQAMR